MDGAGPLLRIRDVILPLLTPITFFLVIVNVVTPSSNVRRDRRDQPRGPGDWKVDFSL
jgi:hypothetical protein